MVDVYVADGASPAERDSLRGALEETANVQSVDFVSKEEALADARRRRPRAENARLLGSNPLPACFGSSRRTPTRSTASCRPASRRAAAGRERATSGTTRAARKILSVTSLVTVVTGGLALLLVIASIALIANTIRLSIFARRREVEVMRLVGATNWFIRWPFMIEGVIVGFIGGMLAVLLLTIAKETFLEPMSDRFALLAAPDTIDFPLLVVLLLLACVAVSAVGSGLTLRRFLRVLASLFRPP